MLIEQVGLSELQDTQKDSIVAFYREQMRNLHDEFDRAYTTRYREILAETRNALRGILTEGQRAQYDSLLVQSDRRRNERRSRESDSDGEGSPAGR